MSHSRGRVLWRWLPGLIVSLLLLTLLLRSLDWKRFPEMVQKAEPVWLFVAAGIELLTYASTAGALQRSIRAAGLRRSLWSLLPLGLAKLFVDQTVPAAGMSGTIVIARGLRQRGLSRGAASGALVVNQLAYYAAYAVAVLAAVAILWSRRGFPRAVSALVTIFALYAIGMPLLILWIVVRPPRRLPSWLERIGPIREGIRWIRETPMSALKHPLLIPQAALFQLGVIALDALSLDVLLHSLGNPVDFPRAFTGFVLASMAGTLSLLPGGLGSFEAAAVASLHSMGVPLEHAIAATILFRGFTLWLPLIPGSLITRREVSASRDEPSDTE